MDNIRKDKGWWKQFWHNLMSDRKPSIDMVEVNWEKRGKIMNRIVLEFEDGQRRELLGSAADEWWHDLHRRNCGRQVDWTRHKWNITNIEKNEN